MRKKTRIEFKRDDSEEFGEVLCSIAVVLFLFWIGSQLLSLI